jgi:S-layer protein
MTILNQFAGLTSDATFGAAATAWENKVSNAVSYGQNVANTSNAPISSVSSTTPPTAYTLTTGIDAASLGAFANGMPGGNSTITGIYNNSSSFTTNTLNALDTIAATGLGNTLNIYDQGVTNSSSANTVPTVSVSGVQTVNLTTANYADANVSKWTGVQTLNVTSAVSNTEGLTVGSTTNVNVSDTSVSNYYIDVYGGNNVTITEATTGTIAANARVQGSAGAVNVTTNGRIEIGTTTAVTGSVTVNSSSSTTHTNSITVDGGTTVSVTVNSYNGAGNITIGGSSATFQATGAVTVVENLTGSKTGNAPASTINIQGGSTVSVTETASQPLSTAPAAGLSNTNYTTSEARVNVTGGSTTSSVTVDQTATVAVVPTTTAQAAAYETASEQFGALTAGQTMIVGGLTFTAGAAGTTAAQTAAAFANLSSGALQGNSTLGSYAGSFTGWNTGAASGTGSTSVVFTATSTATGAAPAFTGSGTAPTATVSTTGLAAVTAVAGVGGVAAGTVFVQDVNYGTSTANTITTVTLNGYGTSSNTIESDALTTLSLANSSGAVLVDNHTTTTLGLTVNNVTGNIDLDGGAAGTYKTLNINTTGADSTSAITATGVTALNVAGTNAIDLTGSTLSALKTATVSGSAGVTVNVSADASFTDFNASGTSGNNTVTINAGNATYEGGSGSDVVTTSANVTKAIALGAGNDTFVLGAYTVAATTGLVDGGAGTNTLSVDATAAATASLGVVFAQDVVNFQHLTLTGTLAGAQVVDVSKLGGYTYVTDGSTTTIANTLTIDNLGSGGTLVLTATGSYDTVNATAASSASNTLNLVQSHAGATTDTVTTGTNANVTTVNLTATDTTANVVAGTNTDTLTLTDAAATTITVNGNAHLSLTSANTSVTSVDASGMTGGLTYTTAGTTAETVKGGASSNVLTAAAGTQADTLVGGAGNDVLTANAGMDTLTGNGGHDTFVIQTPSTNLNSYANITDAMAGDTIKMNANVGDTFNQSAITLGNTAVFQDYANAVVHGTTAHAIEWFQYSGNTYIIQNLSGATSFTNGTDLVVKLTGLVDLSHTSINPVAGTLLIG